MVQLGYSDGLKEYAKEPLPADTIMCKMDEPAGMLKFNILVIFRKMRKHTQRN
jgi:hypothetical protein